MQWQERHDVDVILVLFACWWPVALDARQWLALHDAARDWNTAVTQRIRRLRRRVRDLASPELYRSLQRLELRAEGIEASWLCRSVSAQTGSGTATADPKRRIARLYPTIPPAERTALIEVLAQWPQASNPRSATQP